MRFLMLSIALIGSVQFAFGAGNSIRPNQFSAKIGSNLMRQFRDAPQDEAKFPALVYLKEQADLQQATIQQTRQARISFIYDALRNTANQSQVNLIAFLKDKGLTFDRYFVTNLVVVHAATKEQIQQIAERDDVMRVVGNPRIRSMHRNFDFSGSAFIERVGDNITATGADRVWSELNHQGEGIVIGAQDTGVEWDHPALTQQYRGNQNGQVNHDYNWHDSIRTQIAVHESRCGYNLKAPCDDNDHGTHTMGSMIGSDGAQNQIGMAPKAKWIACRNMDGGTGSPQTYIECFQFFLAPTKVGEDPFTQGDPTKAPHIVNNSWGCDQLEGCEGGEFEAILRTYKAAGIMIVTSAGNDGEQGCGTIESAPAFHTDLTLAVGAFDHRAGSIAKFSSRGPSTYDSGVGPDVVAPGDTIRSSVPGKKYASFLWNGTSMASPHVAGAIALLWSAKPELIGKIDETTRLIRAAATPKTTTETCGAVPGTQIPNNTYGYGVLNALKTIQLPTQLEITQ